MKKISKSIKKCLAFCLTASMLISTAATVSATDRLWTVNYQNGGTLTNTVNFGAVDKGDIHSINLKSERFAAKAFASSQAGTISDESFLILDINMATNEDGLTIYSQPDGNLPLIERIPFDKGQWHAVRLVVEKPMLEDDTEAGSVYLAKHKVYVDGKLKGTYNAVEGDKQRTWLTSDSKWNVVNNLAWGVSVAKQSTDKYIYAADLRVSSAATDPGPYSLPAVDTNNAYKAINGTIMPTKADGVKVSDITCAGGEVFVTDTKGQAKTGDAVLADGDRIVVDKDKLYNTYFYKTNHVFYERNDWSGKIAVTRIAATSETGKFGKGNADASAKLVWKDVSDGPYLDLGNFKDVIGADYVVYEANVMPLANLSSIAFTTDRAYGLTTNITVDKLEKDCWNKVVFVTCKNDKTAKDEYKCYVYANGKFDRIGSTAKVPGDMLPFVNAANPEKPVSAIRFNFDGKEKTADSELAYVDDVKIYETYIMPTIEYTVTDSNDAVYDKDNNMMYATSNDAIATACGATLVSAGDGWVIVKRGNENYSKYNVRTLAANTISRDGNEFWGKTTSETTAKDKFIAATYDASGRLTGAQLIDGTSIGNKILKCTFEPTESSRLFFWNFENLRPHAQSLDVTVSK